MALRVNSISCEVILSETDWEVNLFDSPEIPHSLRLLGMTIEEFVMPGWFLSLAMVRGVNFERGFLVETFAR